VKTSDAKKGGQGIEGDTQRKQVKWNEESMASIEKSGESKQEGTKGDKYYTEDKPKAGGVEEVEPREHDG
jgi:hypothetical protein